MQSKKTSKINFRLKQHLSHKRATVHDFDVCILVVESDWMRLEGTWYMYIGVIDSSLRVQCHSKEFYWVRETKGSSIRHWGTPYGWQFDQLLHSWSHLNQTTSWPSIHRFIAVNTTWEWATEGGFDRSDGYWKLHTHKECHTDFGIFINDPSQIANPSLWQRLAPSPGFPASISLHMRKVGEPASCAMCHPIDLHRCHSIYV